MVTKTIGMLAVAALAALAAGVANAPITLQFVQFGKCQIEIAWAAGVEHVQLQTEALRRR